MGELKPPSFVLPETFDPREFLKSPKLSRRLDDARYFVNLILRKMANGEVDQSNSQSVVRLQAMFLKKIMYQSDYESVIDALLTNGAVERYPYQVGVKSFGYALSARFANDCHKRVVPTDERLIGRLDKFHREYQAEQKSRFQPVHHCLERLQWKLMIDGDKARAILAGLPPKSNRFDAQGVLVRDIEEGTFRFSLGQYGRISNSITSLKREVREALHVNTQGMNSVDLSCAQPAFIAKLIEEKENDETRAIARCWVTCDSCDVAI